VEAYQKELTEIKTILKNNPKGMTVTDIAREININRNSVAKYLDILLISGHAEMLTFGPAKVFFPSRRIPLSTVLNFISDCVLVVDADLKIILINDTFLSFLKLQREELVGQFMNQSTLSLFTHLKMIQHVQNALEGKEIVEELCYQTDDDNYYFCIRLLPTTFEDAGHGVTIIFTNITEKKRIEHALQGEKKNGTQTMTIKKECFDGTPQK